MTLASTGEVEWRPGIYAFANSIVAPTTQGLDIQHNVAVYPAGSGCVGEPISILARWPDRYRNPWDDQAYDPQTGNLYRIRGEDSGFTVNDSVDVLEYDERPQYFNGNNIGCRTTVPFTDAEYNPNQELSNGQQLLVAYVYATSNYHTYMYSGTDENGVAIRYQLTIDPIQ